MSPISVIYELLLLNAFMTGNFNIPLSVNLLLPRQICKRKKEKSSFMNSMSDATNFEPSCQSYLNLTIWQSVPSCPLVKTFEWSCQSYSNYKIKFESEKLTVDLIFLITDSKSSKQLKNSVTWTFLPLINKVCRYKGQKKYNKLQSVQNINVEKLIYILWQTCDGHT